MFDSASGQAIDFTQFAVDNYPRTNGFPEVRWLTTDTTAMIDDEGDEGDPNNPFDDIPGTQNASVNVLYGPDTILGKRITGKLSPGNGTSVDDDVVGFVLGFQPGDASSGLGTGSSADYLLIDWKGVDQTFDFDDPPTAPIGFHNLTSGGFMPAGLAISRINGLPNADELWRHIDDEDGLDGGVTELQRGLTLSRQGYSRDATRDPYEFDITYTQDRVTVFVDGVLQLDVQGTFPDGRFGLYTLSQGPTPIYSDFEMVDASSSPLPDAFPSATINRDTGELVLTNSSSSSAQFYSVNITSAAGSLAPSEWVSIAGNYDDGAGGSVDSDPWMVDVRTVNEFLESEQAGALSDGATLGSGQSISLGDAWTASLYEDIVVTLEFADGLSIPILPSFTGNGGVPYARTDLDTDGDTDLDDWQMFYPNILTNFAGVSDVEAALLGDLDGDFDNDLDDFALFKTDYEAQFGAGAFAAVLSGSVAVPEPATYVTILLATGLVAVWRRKQAVMLAVLGLCIASTDAQAQQLDFTQFTLEAYPRIESGFPAPDWTTTAPTATDPSTATITGGANRSPSVLYSPTNLINNRIRGKLMPGTDDDVVGLVFGFDPGGATLTEDAAPEDYEDVDYLVLDWKGIDQSYNFGDESQDAIPFNSLTGSGFMPAGIAVSQVKGLPTMDELWQHDALEENPLGSVNELTRANTMGFTPYDRFADPLPEYEFDIVWTDNVFAALVDGELEILAQGDFSDGRFGVYTCCQSGGPVFSDFEVLPVDSLDLSSLVVTATVDRSTGDIVIENNTGNSVMLDSYLLRSTAGALDNSWQGLADGETGADANPGISWVEAGGSNANELSEVFLQSAVGSTDPYELANGGSIVLEGAFNGLLRQEDLRLSFFDSAGSATSALINYEGEFPDGLQGDYNGDGQVTIADYAVWRNSLGGPALMNETASPGVVDAADYDAWKSNFGAGVSGTSASLAGQQVPEPMTLALLLTGCALMVWRRR